MGYTILLKATSKNLKMLRFTVFTVLATVAMLTEAAPGGGYYYKKAKKPAPPAPATRTAAVGNLVEVAVGLDGFSTLVGLVKELGLVETLSNVKAATVFAPTDDAFVGVSFNDGARSNVIIADVEASNGVIHAIDS